MQLRSHVPTSGTLSRVVGEFLWAVILIPILAISWVGFYTIARDIGAPVVFAAGLSAAFDGMALFAARIGLKHRRKGFSGYLARITVVLFAALGAFVQSFHAQSYVWIHAHSWVVWSIAPIAAALAYELHLGWVHRKQLIRTGYVHPSAKSGFGPATWIMFPRETLHDYRDGLRARRTYIASTNLRRFELEEAAQPQLPTTAALSTPSVPTSPSVPNSLPMPTSAPVATPRTVPSSKRSPTPRRPSTPRPTSTPAANPLRSVPTSGGRSNSKASSNQEVRNWCEANGYALGFGGRVPIAGLNAYRKAQREQRAS
jgi:hypothetical protein